MFKHAVTFAVAFVALLQMTPASRADFVIDTFTSPNPAGTFSLSATRGVTYSQTDHGINGGTRTWLAGRENFPGVGQSVANGFLGLSATSGAGMQFTTTEVSAPSGMSSSTYAFLLYTYQTRLDLTRAGDVLSLAFDQLQTAMPVYIRVVGGNGEKEFSTYLQTNTMDLKIPLSDFVGFGDDALADAERVIFYFNLDNPRIAQFGNRNASITVRDIRITSPDAGGEPPPVDPVVPAPPVAVLLLLAAPALGLVRFGRRKLGL